MAKELDCEQILGWAVENIKLDNRWFNIYFKSKALLLTADNAELLTTNILEKGWKKTEHVNLVGPDAVSWKLYTHQLILSFVRLGDIYDSFKWSRNIATNYFTARPGYRETFGDEIGEKMFSGESPFGRSNENTCLHVVCFSEQSISGRYCRNEHGKVIASFHFASVIEKLFISYSYTVHI